MTNQIEPSQFYEESYKAVMADLMTLEFDGSFIPCTFHLNGEHAFPLLMNNHDQILIAASLYGRGRIIAMSHEGLLKAYPALVEKALNWLREGSTEKKPVGFHVALEGIAHKFKHSSFQVRVLQDFNAGQEIGVYVTDPYSIGEHSQELVTFLKSGGGILIEGQGWSWEEKNPGKTTIFEFPANRVSGVAGIYFTGECGNIENVPIFPEMPSFWTSINVGKNFKEELDYLFKGITGFDLHGNIIASTVLVHGSLAFPIGVTAEGYVFLAGSYYGLGRVIVATHEALLSTKTPSSFWKNAISWLDNGREGVIGFNPEVVMMETTSFKCEQTRFRPNLSVYICKAYKDDHFEDIQNFVAEGRGLIIAGNVWKFSLNHPELNPLQDFPGNKISNKMGLTFMKEYIKAGSYRCADHCHISHFHFRRLLQRLSDHEDEPLTEQEEEELRKSCTTFLRIRSWKSFYHTQVVIFLTNILMEFGIPKVSEKHPAKTANERTLLCLASEVFNASPKQEALLSHLNRDSLSFHLIHNQRVRITAKTTEKEEWISTGLYLPPGLKTNVIVPSEIVKKGWQIQIGCQTDVLENKRLKRAPSVCERYFVNFVVMEVWNLWGGLIYLLPPPHTSVKGLEIVVQSAVLAPYYKSGMTAEDWYLMREAPAPWAEFEFDGIILTVPSDLVRNLDQTNHVEKLWNDILAGVENLGALSNTVVRKERLVADVQISSGWLHAGYPIMMHSSQASVIFRTENARNHGLWAILHELGHNRQRDCWEFKPYTTNALCDLWSVYISEEVLGIKREKANSALILSKRIHRIEEYVRAGMSLDNWNFWTCLETYLQLQEKFGWDAFKKVFTAYHKISNYPKENPEKMNLYAEIFSRTVSMNLADFFKTWGWPIEKSTEEKLSIMPSWKNHPMIKYTHPGSTSEK